MSDQTSATAQYEYLTKVPVQKLVLTLAVQIRLRTVESELSALQKEKAELEREIGVLSVRLASRTSLEEIERRAEEELGMRPCRGDQIAEIGIEEDAAA